MTFQKALQKAKEEEAYEFTISNPDGNSFRYSHGMHYVNSEEIGFVETKIPLKWMLLDNFTLEINRQKPQNEYNLRI